MKKENVLNEIIKHYIKSHDFNGLPVYNIKYYNIILCELIDEGLIEVLSEKEVINPHIKGFDFNIPVNRQKENISMRTNYSVLYPMRKAFESVPLDYTKPYSVLMQKGEKRFKIIYLNI